MEVIGVLTSTEGRQTTEMIEGAFSRLDLFQEGFDVFESILNDEELQEDDRWYNIEENEEGRKFATTGRVDLEYYIEVKDANLLQEFFKSISN